MGYKYGIHMGCASQVEMADDHMVPELYKGWRYNIYIILYFIIL